MFPAGLSWTPVMAIRSTVEAGGFSLFAVLVLKVFRILRGQTNTGHLQSNMVIGITTPTQACTQRGGDSHPVTRALDVTTGKPGEK